MIEPVILTSKQVLFTFGISRETLRRWGEKGLPKIDRGRFDLKAVIDWRDGTLFKDNLDAMRAARLRRETARAEREELKAKQEKEELVSRSAAIEWVSGLVAEARAGFLNLPRRMGAELATISDEKEIETILRNQIFTILNELARGGYAKDGDGGSGRCASRKH